MSFKQQKQTASTLIHRQYREAPRTRQHQTAGLGPADPRTTPLVASGSKEYRGERREEVDGADRMQPPEELSPGGDFRCEPAGRRDV